MNSELSMVAVAGMPGASKTWATTEALRSPEFAFVAETISLGNVLRGIISGERMSDYAPQVMKQKNALAKGGFISGSLTKLVLEETLLDCRHKQIVLVDGYPRTEVQAQDLEQVAALTGRTLCGVLVFDIDPETSRQRQLQRRSRSGEMAVSEGVIARRQFEYQAFTVPAINYMRDIAELPIHMIDAEQNKADTLSQVTQALRLLTKQPASASTS